MYKRIAVKVTSLDDLFSDAYRFVLPYFQRAYAWRTPQISRLLTNLADVMDGDGHKQGNRYFLGSLMLAEEDGSADTALVDGHQRMMSLTLLFSVLRDMETDPARQSELHARVVGGRGVRLGVQEHLAEFCRTYVQDQGATRLGLDEDEDDLSETQRNIIENREFLRATFAGVEWPEARRRKLVSFLCAQCDVIVATVDTEDAAWQILQIEDETRLEFVESDHAKWSLLSMVPLAARAQCQLDWEHCEYLLGADSLYRLLEHIRTLKTRKASDRPIEIDMARHFSLDRVGPAQEFYSNTLRPRAERLAWLKGRDTIHGSLDGTELGQIVERMCWVNDQLWVPPALAWYAHDRPIADSLTFFWKLDRLLWMLRLANIDPSKQMTQTINLVKSINKGGGPDGFPELEISKALREAALQTLRGKTFQSRRYSPRVLRYISMVLGHDPGAINKVTVTIEHILPRGYVQKNAWRTHYPKKADVLAHSNKLGNLTFLTAEDNRLADSLDWSEKRKIYAGSKFKMSRDIVHVDDWTPAVIDGRTEELIGSLFAFWKLTD